MANDINRSIKIYIDTTEAGKSIEGLNVKIKTMETSLNKLDTSDPAQAAQAKKMTKELESSYQTLNRYKKGIQETDNVLRNLSGSTYKELTAVQSRIRKDLSSTARGTTEYNLKLEQLKRVSKEVAVAQGEMKTVVGAQGTMWSRASGFINKYIGLASTAIAGITGVTLAFNSLRQERNKLEEAQADVKALTGLDDESITWLTEQARKLSTSMTEDGIRIRSSADEILEAYKLVGSAKPELLGDKEALAEVTEQTLILAEASGMKLTDAVEGVTLAMNQYGAAADQASRFTNVMAAGAKFGSAEVEQVTDAMRRSGVSAASANVSIEQLVGTIETLAEKGIKEEVAGTGLKRFFLTLQTGADETNPKVVGLQTALQNLAAEQLSATEIKKKFGEEGYNVASVLINEAEKVNYYTKAVTGTTAALEQAGVKSNTATAKLAQVKNRITELGVELLEKMNPGILAAANGMVNWTRKIVELATWIGKNTQLLAILAIELASYTAAVKLAASWETIRNIQIKETIVQSKLYATIVGTVRIAELAAAAAVALMTGNVQRARIAWAAMTATMNVNIFVAIGTAIAALTIGIYKLATRTTSAKEAMKEFNTQCIKEQTELTKLYTSLKRAGEGTQQRIDLIKEFNTKYGEYLPHLLSENSTLGQIKTAYDQVTSAMRRNLAQKILNQKTESIMNNSLESEQSQLDDVREQLQKALPESQISKALADVVSKTEMLNQKGYSLKETWGGVFQYLQKQYFGNNADSIPAHLANQLKDYVKEVYKAASDIASVKQQLSPFTQDTTQKTPDAKVYAEATVTATAPTTGSKSGGGSGSASYTKSTADQEKAAQEARLKVITDSIAAERAAIEQKFMDGAIMYDDYNKQIEALTLSSLEQQLTAYGVNSEGRRKIEEQIFTEKKRLVDEAYQHYIEELDAEAAADTASKNKKAQNAKDLNVQLQQYVKTMNTRLKSQEESSLNSMQNIASKYQNNILDFAAAMGEELGTSLTDTETSLADALGNILLLALDTLRQIATMAIAQATIQNVAKYGIKGLIKAAAEIALINAAYYAIKGLIKKPTTSGATGDTSGGSSTTATGRRVATTESDGYASGGYTGDGGDLEAAGIVHRNEYVVPAWEMTHPAAMNHVAALEAIRMQRSGGAAHHKGYAEGGLVTSSSTGNDQTQAMLIKAIESLTRRMETPSKSYVVLSEFEAKQTLRDKARSIGSK